MFPGHRCALGNVQCRFPAGTRGAQAQEALVTLSHLPRVCLPLLPLHWSIAVSVTCNVNMLFVYKKVSVTEEALNKTGVHEMGSIAHVLFFLGSGTLLSAVNCPGLFIPANAAVASLASGTTLGFSPPTGKGCNIINM